MTLRFSGRAMLASVATTLLLVSPARSAGTDFRFEIVQVLPAALTLTAKIPGENDTVRGTVTFDAK